MVLHLHLRRASPALALYQAKHRSEAVGHKVHVLRAVVGVAHHTLARHVVGVVCLRSGLGVLQLARQVAVVKRDLRERELRRVPVYVGHLLVHEGGVGVKGVLQEQAVLRLVQIVGHGALAQAPRLAALVGPLLRVEQLARLGVVHVKLTAHKRVVHLPHVGVERLVGQRRYRQYQPLRPVVHLAARLVAKLAADEALVAVPLVLRHLLPEAQHARRQRVPGLRAVALHGCRHHAPVILLAHRPLYRPGVVVELDAGVQHRGVRHVFLHVLVRGVVVAALRAPVVEIGHGRLVRLVVGLQPCQQHLHRRVGIDGLQACLIGLGQARHGYQGVVLGGAASATHHVDATARRQLLVVRHGHHTAVHKLAHRDA